jgi:hypothetical protein
MRRLRYLVKWAQNAGVLHVHIYPLYPTNNTGPCRQRRDNIKHFDRKVKRKPFKRMVLKCRVFPFS